MNIAIDIRGFFPEIRTGVGEYVFGLLSELFARHPEHRYFLLSSGRVRFTAPSGWIKPNVTLIHLSWSNRLLNVCMFFLNWPRLGDWPRLAKITAPKFDSIYFPNLNFAPIDASVKTIVTIHDAGFFLFPEFFSVKQLIWHFLARPVRFLKNADRVIVPSSNTRRDCIDFFGVSKKRISVVYPGLPAEFFFATENDRERVQKKYNLPENFILFLGTFEPRKNVAALVYAFWELKRKNSKAANIKLVVAGAAGWKNKKIKKMIAKDPSIISIGYVDAKDKRGLYAGACVFAYPSFYEGFGFPVLEAMAAGTPVIISNGSSLGEVAGSAAYTVNSYRIDEIVRGLELLLFDEETRARYREHGFAQAKKFSWEKAAREFLDLCEK